MNLQSSFDLIVSLGGFHKSFFRQLASRGERGGEPIGCDVLGLKHILTLEDDVDVCL